jgi:hypothetical protein
MHRHTIEMEFCSTRMKRRLTIHGGWIEKPLEHLDKYTFYDLDLQEGFR